jgi:WD40 repeat protein
LKPGEPAARGRAPAAAAGTISNTGEHPLPEATLEASRTGDLLDRDDADRLDLPVIARERYLALGEHARGGLGRVMRARDRQLGRAVAIKEMLAPEQGGAAATRFVREALVTARLQHPGIVPVYDAGYWPGGEPFYAMKLVSGRSLKDAISAAAGLEQRLALLPQVLAATQAVAYAHSEGVIHRDLKPSNVVLGPFGETVVVDWGLAKDLRVVEAAVDQVRPTDVYELSHFDMTREGAVVGTPGFMPPEQVAGEVVDARADVYALGALLYSVLTGELPAEPRRDLEADGVPRDLCAIVAKAMAPAAGERYADAGQLADDLSRYLAGQLVLARRYGRLTRAARFFNRRRVPLTVAALLVVALAATGVASVVRIVHARNEAEARSAELIVAQARAYLERDPTLALAWLERYPADGRDHEAAVALAADAVSRGVARHVIAPPAGVELLDAGLSPDGTTVVAADGRAIYLWDVGSAALRRTVALGGATRVAFAPDGRQLAVLGESGDVWLVEVASGGAKRLGAHRGSAGELAFDRQGRWLVTSGADGDIRVWPRDGGAPRTLPGHPGGVHALAFTSDGRLLSAGRDGALLEWPDAAGPPHELYRGKDEVYRLATDAHGGLAFAHGNELERLGAGAPLHGKRDSAITALAFTGAGVLVSGAADGQVSSWPAEGEPVALGRHLGAVVVLAVGAHDELASGDDRGEIQVHRGGELSTRRGHESAIRSLAFAGDGSLLSRAARGPLRVWSPPPAYTVLAVGHGHALELAWSPSSESLGAGSYDGSVRWFAGLAAPAAPLGRHQGAVWKLALSRDGKLLVSGGWDGDVGLWPVDGGAGHLLHHEGGQVWALAVSPDGQRVVSGGNDGSVRVWEVASGAGREVFRHPSHVEDAVFSPDGHRLATSSNDALVHVHDLAGGAGVDLRAGVGGVTELAFSPDGQTLYGAGMDGVVRAWSVRGGTARELARHEHTCRALALSPDGQRVASASLDGVIQVVDLRRGRTEVLRGHEATVRDLAFSPDGRQLASAGWDGTVRVWGLDDGARAILRSARGKVQRLAFAPDGGALAWSNEDGTVTVRQDLIQGHVPGSVPGHGDLAAWLAKSSSAKVNTGSPLATPAAAR